MSVEDDIARVNAVTDALTGPQRVWVLTNAIMDRSGMCVGVSVHTTEAKALISFGQAMRDAWDGVYEGEELDDHIAPILVRLQKDGVAEDGDVTWTLQESTLD